jgi:hypothetical protein
MTKTETKVLTGARGRVAAAKAKAKAAADHAFALAVTENVAQQRAAKAAAKPAANGVKTPRPGTFVAKMVELLVRKQGATRPEMKEGCGSKTMPSANGLDPLAAKFGYVCFAANAARTPLLVYQFVKPGQKPTAFDAVEWTSDETAKVGA